MGKFVLNDIFKRKEEKASVLEKAKQKIDMIKTLTALKVKGLGNFGLKELYGTFKFGMQGYIDKKPSLLHKAILKELIVFGLTDKRDQDIRERIVEISGKSPELVSDDDVEYVKNVFYPYVKNSYESQAKAMFGNGYIIPFDDVVVPSNEDAEKNFNKFKDAKRGHVR
jgi:hypothetical protein